MRKAGHSPPDARGVATMNRESGRGPWTLPALAAAQSRAVGGGAAEAGGNVVWITAGARLEVSGFVAAPSGDGHLLLEGVAGQATLASAEPDEASVLDVLARRHGALAVEQVLCDDGVLEMYRAICLLRGMKPRRIDAARIVACAAAARDPQCSRALAMFCGLLGDLAGHVALTLGARGGVVIAGDIAASLGDWFVRSPFRRRFESRGRCRDTLRAIPTLVVGAAVTPRFTLG
jgi:glucokinase